MNKLILMAVVFAAIAASARSEDILKQTNKERGCECIKNIDGACMSLSHRGLPSYDRGMGIDDQYSPHCTSNCMPGYVPVLGYDEQTKRELAACYVDWDRLYRLNPQWKQHPEIYTR